MIPRKWNWMTVVVTKSYEGDPTPTEIVPNDVVVFAETHFGVDPGTIHSGRRMCASVQDMKHMLRHYLRLHFTGMSLGEIGCATGNARHSTVLCSIRRHSELMQYDQAYRKAYSGFEFSAFSSGYHYKRERL